MKTATTTFKATETYDYSPLASDTQLCVFLRYDNPSEHIDKWTINPDAELRFWMKSEHDTTFHLNSSGGR